MKIAIRYYSKTGHMKKMADVVAGVTGVEAMTIDEPIDKPVDVLWLGTAVYAAGIDSKVKKFIASLDPAKVGRVVCFSSAAILQSSYAQVKSLLEKQGLTVDEREFHCRGQFTLLHRGHPDENDLRQLREFAESMQA